MIRIAQVIVIYIVVYFTLGLCRTVAPPKKHPWQRLLWATASAGAAVTVATIGFRLISKKND